MWNISKGEGFNSQNPCFVNGLVPWRFRGVPEILCDFRGVSGDLRAFQGFQACFRSFQEHSSDFQGVSGAFQRVSQVFYRDFRGVRGVS